MKKLLKLLFGLVVVVLVTAVGVYAWATSASNDLRSRTIATHTVAFPVPFPLSEEEIAEADLDPSEAEALALERAVERGRHLVLARYGCVDCHGQDFSGGVMVDAFPIGTLLGPNLTAGEGSMTAGYTPADWDRIVRHGVRPDGTPAAMPSADYLRMSDQELSDIVAYIRSHAPVDNVVPPVTLGPLGRILVATGQLPLSADLIGSHDVDHEVFPPPAEVSAEFGQHLAGVCTGCHGQTFAGGPIAGGDPSWAPARNLTPHAQGLEGWSYDDFVTAMREGRRPDGTDLVMPMTLVLPIAQEMTETELQALWAYLGTLQPLPTGG